MHSDLTALLSSDEPATSQQGLPVEMREGELATLLGVTGSRVRTLAQDGAIVRSRRGWYDVAASVTAYCARLREAAERAGRPSLQSDEVKAAAARLKAAQADLAELKASQARGEVVPIADVVREWASLLRDLRNALLAVPSRCGASLPHLTATDISTMEQEIRIALEGLADAD
ncbi:terminase small subunit [Celeribacter neptunius]|uniref:Phage DNA packaging protein, Nu1 subunit of terminase n=1 Tax=Celeribacter neptunius TaxID=588602 RepID=A0A1I3TTS7_9RHOB|nr:terminase small subunit [Celeribacter neptunius]SFJ73749.1 Phage DNA packaging protein, Nu1 subunit of terminase [Celeribacter neptunius]